MPFDLVFDCPRPIHLSKPWLFRCQHFFFFVKSYLTLRATLLIYFPNTSACLACTEVVPDVSVCFARLYGQWLVFHSFLSSPFPVTLAEVN